MAATPIRMMRTTGMVETSHSSRLIRHDKVLITQILNQDICLAGWQK